MIQNGTKQYFEIRKAPGDDVIALWVKEVDTHHLELLCSEGGLSGYFQATLLKEIPEAEYSVLNKLCAIPHIEDVDLYHFLGNVRVPEDAPEVIEEEVVALYAVVIDLDDATVEMKVLGGGDEYDEVVVAEAVDDSVVRALDEAAWEDGRIAWDRNGNQSKV